MKSLLFLFIGMFMLSSSLTFGQIAHDISFTIRNFGINVDGNFDSSIVDGTLNLSTLQNTQLRVSIPVNSINTDNETRDEHLLEEEYFHASKYPNIQFESTSLREIAERAYELRGNLTIKGVTKAVVIKMYSESTSNTTRMVGELEINRRDYGVGGRSLVMSKNVTISITLEIPKA
ncbi:YceI family protein [Gilvibacter sediminis]|uniref:YceI family protein n=1 Tax=Gilvibacter sediminis TaxID=379071 RepID=UPI00234FCBB5|nr:YceI family protein [Gilvibacter sediminis]MDC7998514.1 YceI family protein [Gilvibacter sediminis]